jgi:hypothetical protein
MSEKIPAIDSKIPEKEDANLHVFEFTTEGRSEFATVVWKGIHFKVNSIGEVTAANDEVGNMVDLAHDERWTNLKPEEQEDLEAKIGKQGEDALTKKTTARMAEILQRMEAGLKARTSE